MRQGKSLMALATELERQSASKRDYVADSRLLKMDDTLTLNGVNGGRAIDKPRGCSACFTVYDDRIEETFVSPS